jgi:hypothetical protein
VHASFNEILPANTNGGEIMKKLSSGLLAALFLCISVAYGSDSFRLENGQLLQNGMTKGEVIDTAGEPKMKDPVRKGEGDTEKKEVWTYFVNNTFGAPSIVAVTFEGNSVVKVEVKQKTSK